MDLLTFNPRHLRIHGVRRMRTALFDANGRRRTALRPPMRENY
jgi:hypothetical protein